MEILEISRDKRFFAVRTADGVYEIDGALLRENGIREGADIDGALLLSLHDRSRSRRAYQRACYLLDERDYSYAMLYRKLMQTYQDKTLVLGVMERLVQSGAIDDRRYAGRLAEYLVERKRYGMYRARQEMLHRGLDRELVEEALDGLEDAAEENLPAVLEKKYGRILTDPKDYKTREKVIAGMARLGYDFRSVKAAIDDYFAALEAEE